MNALGERLGAACDWLREHLRPRAGATLLRMEELDDLVQGVVARALEQSAGFEWRGEPAFRAWLAALAENHLRARRAHWAALRRGGGRVLRRLSTEESSGPALVSSRTGPSTLADRRETIAIAAKALSLLPARDREWIESWLAGESLADAARARGTTYDAAERTRLRALGRFRRVFELVRTGW